MSDFEENPFPTHDSGSSSRATGQQWVDIFFSKPCRVATPHARFVQDGPLGNSRLANSGELQRLRDAAESNPENYLQLLQAFAVAHDPKVVVRDIGSLPIPLGTDSPNLLFFGRAGSGKTQKGTLPAAYHAFREGWSMVYINVKGRKQTRLLRRFAKIFDRDRDIRLVAPTKLNRTMACTLLEGGKSLSIANEIANCMVASAAGRSRDGEGAWAYNQAQEWLQHAIAAICNDLPKSQHNLLEIRKVVMVGDYQRFADAHPEFPVLRKFARYLDGGNKNAETITATISESTAFIDDIAEFLGRDEIRLHRFATKGGCWIIEIDQADIKRMRPVITLLLGRLIGSLQRVANNSVTGCLPNKTVIIIDELIAAGPIPGLAEAVHTSRELGFYFVAGIQSISQLATIYGPDAAAVLDGFQSQIALGEGLDPYTAEHFSRRAGTATIALPSVQEPLDSDDGPTMLNRNWQMMARPILLPSDISSPEVHPLLGMPATILMGDGRTPPFQAYLTPAYEEGAIAKLMDEVARQTTDEDLRRRPLKKNGKRNWGIAPLITVSVNFTDGRGMNDREVQKILDATKTKLDLEKATAAAREWWQSFEDENKQQLPLVLRLAEELVQRNATLNEFFLAYVESDTDNILANLHYFDYTRLKQEQKKKKRAKRYPVETKDAEPPMLSTTASTGYKVIVTNRGRRTILIANAVKDLNGLTLLQAKRMVDKLPAIIGRCESRENADSAVAKIAAVGGSAHVE